MPFSSADEAKRRALTEAHNPPLYTAQEAADILGVNLHALREIVKKEDWVVYHLPGPFHKANCYAQANIEAAKSVLEENGGHWPAAGVDSSGSVAKEHQKRAEARDMARLDNNRCAIQRRCPSFAEFSPAEQEAFVADMVDKDKPAARLLTAKHDLAQFVTATRRLVPSAQVQKVLQCVDLYYGATVNFGYLNPSVAVRVLAELLATAHKPTTKKR